ncbi:hypothetical protein [Tardiphaga sp. P5_C7]
MKYRDSMLTFAFLTAAGVIAVAMAVDPKGFSIREWQTLLAAFVALGAATLAYRAAMAKVDLDRDISDRDKRRNSRGISLRAQHAAFIALQEAEHFIVELTAPAIGEPDKNVDIREITFSSTNDLDEAWANLDRFPRHIATLLGEVRTDLMNIRNRFKIIEGDTFTIKPDRSATEPSAILLQDLKRMEGHCNSLHFSLKEYGLALDD